MIWEPNYMHSCVTLGTNAALQIEPGACWGQTVHDVCFICKVKCHNAGNAFG